MLVKIYPENPKIKTVDNIVDVLRAGGIVIIPTDTVYSFACDMKNAKAARRLAEIKGEKLEKAHFSLITKDLSDLSNYSKQIGNHVFKVMKKNLPGPFTFILNANSNVPKIFQSKKKTIGIRVPDHSVAQVFAERLGNPLMVSSVKSDDEITEYMSDPELIHDRYKEIVDYVVDSGLCGIEPSTVIDCTNDEVEIVRQAKGIVIE